MMPSSTLSHALRALITLAKTVAMAAFTISVPVEELLARTSPPASASEVACMTRTADGNTWSVVLPSADIEAMSPKGFALVDCGLAFGGEAAQRQWRDKICLYAATMPEGMQEQMAGVMGERPATLCGLAELVLGRWDQRQMYE